jgi:hypothetical protein
LRAQRRLEETRRSQAAAADPATSAWVSANAGTGKTHVLTMRVLRLLLNGTLPGADSSADLYQGRGGGDVEARVRAAGRVGDDARRRAQGQARRAARPVADGPEIERARQLFAIAIETPGGLKVQTIHAFCERLLQRFPLEAGVPPGFAILDDQERPAAGARPPTRCWPSDRAPVRPLAERSRRPWPMPPTAISISCFRALREQDWLPQPCGSTTTAMTTLPMRRRSTQRSGSAGCRMAGVDEAA